MRCDEYFRFKKPLVRYLLEEDEEVVGEVLMYRNEDSYKVSMGPFRPTLIKEKTGDDVFIEVKIDVLGFPCFNRIGKKQIPNEKLKEFDKLKKKDQKQDKKEAFMREYKESKDYYDGAGRTFFFLFCTWIFLFSMAISSTLLSIIIIVYFVKSIIITASLKKIGEQDD